MLQLVYVSSATVPFDGESLRSLLARTRDANAQRGVSGMLLHAGGNFIQVLEGDPAVVEPLFERIKADPRHRGVLVLLRRTIEAREFEGWSMGFRDLSDPTLVSTPGYATLMNEPITVASVDATRALKLLRAFRSNQR